MTENSQLGKDRKPKFALTAGLFAVAIGILVAVIVANDTQPVASECPINSELGAAVHEAAQGELAALLVAQQGRNYADLSFQNAQGELLTLDDFAGKSLLVNFWATWCGPCREEMPDLDTLAAEYNSESFELLTINLDLGENGPTLAQEFLDENNLPNLALYADPTFAAFERLKTDGVALGLPATLLIDEQGCEVAVLQGPAHWDSQDGRNVVEVLMGDA